MNINFPNSSFDGPQVNTKDISSSRGVKSAQSAGESGRQSITGSREVSLSEINIAALKSQLAGLPNIREDRVQVLTQAIQNGSYEVNGKQLADAIHADLFGPTNSGS